MRFFSIVRIAYHNLIAFKMRSFVTLGGMVIGIAAIIFLVSLGYGVQNLVNKELISFEDLKTIDILPGGAVLPLSQKHLKEVEKMEKVKAVYPVIDIASRLKYKKSLVEALGHGTEYDYLRLKKIVSSNQPWQENEIIITKGVAQLFGQEPNKMQGEKIKIQTVVPAELIGNGSEKKIIEDNNEFIIKAVVENNEKPEFYFPIGFLYKKGVKNNTFATIIVGDTNYIVSLRRQIETMGLKTEYIGDTLSEINNVFRTFRIVLGVFGSVALVVAALGMFNTLSVSLLERIREVGLMKALGMRSREIGLLFISEGIILGLSGGIIGIITGIVIGKLLNLFVVVWAKSQLGEGFNFFNTPWLFALAVAGISFLISLLAAIYPARRAIKIKALDALRYE